VRPAAQRAAHARPRPRADARRHRGAARGPARSDPDFLLPEEYEKRRWDALVADVQADVAAKSALLAHTVKAA
jgi:hypothetical protein